MEDGVLPWDVENVLGVALGAAVSSPVFGRKRLDTAQFVTSASKTSYASSIASAFFFIEIKRADFHAYGSRILDKPLSRREALTGGGHNEWRHDAMSFPSVMSEGPLLEALSTLYHNPDPDAKHRASQWLEEWQLKTEAWEVAVRVLHSALRNVEVLFFCSKTLVVKIQQDFEELPQNELMQLRESLMGLLLKFSREEGLEVVQKQLALALAAFSAHVPASFWSPVSCVHWCAERLWQESDVASISSLTELLTVLPEEARSQRIGLHPDRRGQYLRELQDSFQTVVQILEKCRTVSSAATVLHVLANWLSLAEVTSMEGHWAVLGTFVQLAVASFEDPVAFPAAVEFLSELLFFTSGALDHPELHSLTEGVASALLQYLPQLTQESISEERRIGLARLFCELGSCHQELVLTQDHTAAALIDAILAVTSHPDEDIHKYAFDFWEQLTYRVLNLIKGEAISTERTSYYISIYERLMTALVELAKLPEDYLDLSEEEREELDRGDFRNAILDAVDVIGAQRSLQSLLSPLLTACQSGAQNWQQIEALLFALDSMASSCKKCKNEMAGTLLFALNAVPDGVILQSAMCRCLGSYGSWLPVLSQQTGNNTVNLLLPVIFKSLSHPESATAAVDAFAALCKFCRAELLSCGRELFELHQQILKAANVSHQWLPAGASSFSLKESEAMAVMGAMIHGMTRNGTSHAVQQLLQDISDDILTHLSSALDPAQTQSHQLEANLAILVSRLETVFRNCALEAFSAQLLRRICSDLLQLANRYANCESLVEGICTCLRYAIKTAGESGNDTLPALCSALPQLFSTKQHCGYLYVASEIAKIFGEHSVHASMVQQLVVDLFLIVCGVLQSPADFKERPDLADDAFLLAGRVLNYCPAAILTHVTLLTQIIDTVTKGVLVQHVDACRSVLRFLKDLVDRHFTHEAVKQAFLPRGALLTQVLLAGVVGVLPLRVLDEMSRVLRALMRSAEGQGVTWLTQSFAQMPDQVLSHEEKTRFLESLRDVQKSDRSFLSVVSQLADVCRRSRVVRQAAQSALTPDTYL